MEVATEPLNVTVSAALLPRMAEHGFVVPEHVEELRLPGALQPPNVDPPLGLALNVTVAPLSDVVIFGEHVLVTVCDAAAAPVPPQETGASTVPVLGVIVTEPLPVPANVKVQLRASLNADCAVKPEDSPIAVTVKILPKSISLGAKSAVTKLPCWFAVAVRKTSGYASGNS